MCRAEANVLVRQVAETNLELSARVAELDTYAQTIAHDLKNPLAAIQGYAEMLTEMIEESPPAPSADAESPAALVNFIQDGARRCAEITDSLLLFARLRNGKDAPRNPLDMGQIAANALARLRFQIAEAEAEVLLPPSWPAALGHPPWIEEIWANYLSNALKYGRPPGNAPLRIELGSGPGERPDLHRFHVRDFGPGLDPDARRHLFLPFSQLGERKDSHGLDLSIVRRICERLGGGAGVESEGVPGQGSRFYFDLPAIP